MPRATAKTEPPRGAEWVGATSEVIVVKCFMGVLGLVVAVSGCGGHIDQHEAAPPVRPTLQGATGSAQGEGARPEEPEAKGTNAWRMVKPAVNGEIAGYVTATSGVAGTSVGLRVSTQEPDYRVKAFRIGWYAGSSATRVWKSRVLKGAEQAEPVFKPYDTRTVVAPWRTSVTVDTTGWLPGFYVFKLRTGTGWETQIPYVVSSEFARNTVALVAPVTTWQAYNRWGGYSLYFGPEGDRRSWAVSFNRPYHQAPGANDYRTAAIPIIMRAERLHLPLSYFTNVDLHARPGVLQGARGYVSMGHDEYWTPAMRREVLKARNHGTSLAFLGANTMYWRIRLPESGTGQHRTVVGYRHDAFLDPLRDEIPDEATARFRDAPAAEPENDVVGMLYECFPVDADYRVVSPTWWGFAGTGVRYGDLIPGLVGPESDRVYPNPSTPRPLQILSDSRIDCRGTTTSSQSVYYTTTAGAGVFAAGTLRWGCALVDRCERPLGERTRAFVRVVTDNLLEAFARGQVGKRHPAHDNVREFDLPLVNGVSAS